uniref:Uncharacterized protein n=1 Tax=Panagrolaimus sp. JU765 TaxID=591449 RepID=A0AC34QU44_9BILA
MKRGRRSAVKESRKSSDLSPKSKKRRSHASSEPETSMMDTAESLAMKLETVVPMLVRSGNAYSCPDLNDFDIDQDMENLEDVKSLREKLKKQFKNFDFDGKTDVNLDSAAIAGAKVMVDERPATRNMTKRLAKEVGINENTLLYDALPSEHVESKVAKTIADQRKESIVESFVDFQKQLRFKKELMEQVAKKINDPRVAPPRRASAAARMNGLVTPPKQKLRKAMTSVRTPKKSRKPNPLSFTKIMDEYTDMLASEIKDRSVHVQKVKPIPLNLENEDPGY